MRRFLPIIALVTLVSACTLVTPATPPSSREQAVLRGLEWTGNFVREDAIFDALASDYLIMLRELRLNRRHQRVRQRADELERLAATRLASRMQRVFPASRRGKDRYLAAAPFLLHHNADRARLERYYAIALADIDSDDMRRFEDALAGHRHSELTDSLINAWHVDHLRRSLPRAQLALPPQRLAHYLNRLAGIEFVYDRRRAGRYSRQNYFVTHAVFVLSDFGAVAPPDGDLSRRLRDYLLDHYDYVRHHADDNDLLAEFVHCLKIYGMDGSARVREAEDYLLRQQNADGGFATADERGGDAYDLFHPTWTAITALNYSSNVQ